jgi:hypothetical protein
MFDVRVVEAFNTAIVKEENWTAEGPNWNFVDADMFMEVTPTDKQVDQFYRMFDDLANDFEKVHLGRDYAAYMQYVKIVEAEYAELFGVAV